MERETCHDLTLWHLLYSSQVSYRAQTLHECFPDPCRFEFRVQQTEELLEEGDDPEWIRLQALGSVDADNRLRMCRKSDAPRGLEYERDGAIEPLRELDSDIPRRVGGVDERLSGQAVNSPQ
jgi:hypothetical protein